MRKFLPIIGKLLTLLSGAAAGLLLYRLIKLDMLPSHYLIIAGVVLGALVLTVLSLTGNRRKIVKMLIGYLLAVALIVGCLYGASYVKKTMDTLQEISSVEKETVYVGVYVASGDYRDYATEGAGYRYGILEDLDRQSTDAALEQMKEHFKTAVQTTAYPNIPQLLAALHSKEVDAVVMNRAYLDILEDLDPNAEKMLWEAALSRVDVDINRPTEPVVIPTTEPTTQPTEPTATEETVPPVTVPPCDLVFSMYLSGIDNRGDLIARSRSDVNVLAVVNASTRQLLLITTPRDYYVPLSISHGQPDKLTHAGIYGVEVSQKTIGMLYDINVDYFFRVNFGGFVNIIDALGGITIHSDYTFDSQNMEGYHFEKGDNEVNGNAALAFCRERYFYAAGDRQRGRNHLEVIRAVADKLTSPAILKNFDLVLGSLAGSFQTTLPYSEISALVSDQLANGGDWNIVTYSVDGTSAKKIPYSLSMEVYVMIPDMNTVNQAKDLISKVVNGEIITQP